MKISNPRYQWMMGDYIQEYKTLKEGKKKKKHKVAIREPEKKNCRQFLFALHMLITALYTIETKSTIAKNNYSYI
jgi:hypothetical protein